MHATLDCAAASAQLVEAVQSSIQLIEAVQSGTEHMLLV